MDDSTLAGRIGYLLGEVPDLGDKELSLLAGLAASHVGQIKRGGVALLFDQTASALARVTGATRSWLAFGEGDPPTGDTVRSSVAAARHQRGTASPTLLPDADAPSPIVERPSQPVVA